MIEYAASTPIEQIDRRIELHTYVVQERSARPQANR